MGICHLYQSFFADLPIPNSPNSTGGSSGVTAVSEFKKGWMQRFPRTVDTKYMAETHELLAPLALPSSLKDLCDFMVTSSLASGNSQGGKDQLKLKVNSCLPGVLEPYPFPDHFKKFLVESEGSSLSNNSNNNNNLNLSTHSHDAGYDATMTALVFIFQTQHILQHKGLTWPQLTSSVASLFTVSLNKIRLVKTLPNVIDLGTQESADALANSKRHLLMQGFPSSWGSLDIQRVWAPVHVTVSPRSDKTSAWIVCRSDSEAENVNAIYDILRSDGKDPPFDLLTYEDYVNQGGDRVSAGSGGNRCADYGAL